MTALQKSKGQRHITCTTDRSYITGGTAACAAPHGHCAPRADVLFRPSDVQGEGPWEWLKLMRAGQTCFPRKPAFTRESQNSIHVNHRTLCVHHARRTLGCAIPRLSNSSGCFRGSSITCTEQAGEMHQMSSLLVTTSFEAQH